MSENITDVINRLTKAAVTTTDKQAIPQKALAIMQAKKWICAVCGQTLSYGEHCKNVPNGNLTLDKTHHDFASLNGYVYQEKP